MTPSVPRPDPRYEHPYVRAVAPAAALASLVLVSVVLSPPAEAVRQPAPLTSEPVGSHRSSIFETPAAEVATVDPGTQPAFVAGTVDVLDLSEPAPPVGEAATPEPPASP